MDSQRPGKNLPRFRFRYSLRMAGIMLTLLCAWLGLRGNEARQQRLATEELHRIGATVVYDRHPEDLKVPSWIRTRIGDDFFLTVVEVRLTHYQVGRKVMALTPAQFQQAVKAMRRLSRLRQITFNHTGLRDEDLRCLAPLASRIESLYFNEFFCSEFTGMAVRHLAGWPRLRELMLHSDRLDKASLTHLADLPALETFGWSGDSLDAEAFLAIAACQRLAHLSLHQCSFSGDAFGQLKSAPRLRSILLHNICSEAVQPGGPVYKFYRANTKAPGPCPHDDEQNHADLERWLKRMLPNAKVLHGMYSS
jgi:hypothetical protein